MGRLGAAYGCNAARCVELDLPHATGNNVVRAATHERRAYAFPIEAQL